MKECPDCGRGFTGFERLCPVCERQARHRGKSEIPKKPKNRPKPEIRENPEILEKPPIPEESRRCPTCGKVMGLTNAERQKRYRERKNANPA